MSNNNIIKDHACGTSDVSERGYPAAARTLHGVRGVLFDLDGTLYRWDEALPGASAFLEFLNEAGIPFAALSNNSQARPAEIAAKLERLGMDFPLERLITSSMASASFVASMYPGSKAYVAGSDSLHEAMRQEDIQCVDGAAAQADVVVLGMSMDLTMQQLSEAISFLRNGAKLVATNPDTLLPVPGGYQPECGAVVALLETASGCEAHVIGKPNPDFFRLGLTKLGCAPEEALMIGDTMEVDILGASQAGMRSAFVATGNPAGESLGISPTVSVADLPELQRLLQQNR